MSKSNTNIDFYQLKLSKMSKNKLNLTLPPGSIDQSIPVTPTTDVLQETVPQM